MRREAAVSGRSDGMSYAPRGKPAPVVAPGEFRFDNVNLHKDPAQKVPLPEEPMRTPNIPRK